jgi:hypothetical protein
MHDLAGVMQASCVCTVSSDAEVDAGRSLVLPVVAQINLYKDTSQTAEHGQLLL